MSLSREPVFSMLQRDFVCGWRNIEKESYCGISGRHSLDNPAVVTTNGAGPHNIQLFVMTPDGIVLHCLPGYWDPRDLATELTFAKELNKVWNNPALTRQQKDETFERMQLADIRTHSREMTNRSSMQGFDKKYEEKRESKDGEVSDCIRHGATALASFKGMGQGYFKTTDQIVHERMSERPFVAYEKFDVAEFSDYGRPKYDKKLDGGEGMFGAKRRR